MRLYNTLTRSSDELKPINYPLVSMYCCGPTVYDVTHIGHMRKYTFDDVLVRGLQYLGYNVKHVMNITDVGHLSEDTDSGEDKLEKGARKYGKSVWDIAAEYTDFFHKTMAAIKVKTPDIECKVTDYIPDIIALIVRLEKKGFTYQTDEAVYFDTSKFLTYGELSGQKLIEKKQAVRAEVNSDPQKKTPADFALWFFRKGRFANHSMHWESPWGEGFPGWHIECSALSIKFLGEQIDIHTGGIDHIPVHHENEIAQSEAATGLAPFSQFWVHHNFLKVDGKKMSKSLGNVYTIEDIIKKDINPISLRLLFMQAHYRQEMNFTWESAFAANEAFKRLERLVEGWKDSSDDATPEIELKYENNFKKELQNDLQTPGMVRILWEMAKDPTLANKSKLNLFEKWNSIFGFTFNQGMEIPDTVAQLFKEREAVRGNKNWTESDRLRDEIKTHGFEVKDTSEGSTLLKL